MHAAGATTQLIGPRLGPVQSADGAGFDATASFDNAAPVLFDGLVLPDGADGVKRLGGFVEVMDFISNQHRHSKTLLALGASRALFEQAGVAATLPGGKNDPGLFVESAAKAEGAVLEFIEALGKHRRPERELAAAAR